METTTTRPETSASPVRGNGQVPAHPLPPDRLDELMTKWRGARDGRGTISDEERGELDALIAVELRASTDREKALLQNGDPAAVRAACHAILDRLPDEALRDAVESLTSDYEMHLGRARRPKVPPPPPAPVRVQHVRTEMAPVNPITELD